MKRQFLSALLALLMVLTLIPSTVLGATGDDLYAEAKDSERYENDTINTQAMADALPQIYAYLEGQNIQKTDDAGKALLLHDFLCTHVVYTSGVAYSHSAYGALVNGQSVCDGFAKAYRILARHYGLECLTAGSKAKNHAWNLVKINGKWYHVDVSSDNGDYYGHFGSMQHSYFLLSTQQLLKLDSVRSDMTIESDLSPSAANSTITGFWSNTRVRSCFDGSYWYYLDSSCRLIRTNLSGSSTKQLTSQQYYWYDWRNYALPNPYSSLVAVNGAIYYCTPTELRCYRIAGGTDSLLLKPTLTQGQVISGIFQNGNTLQYAKDSDLIVAGDESTAALSLPSCSHRYYYDYRSAGCSVADYQRQTCIYCQRSTVTKPSGEEYHDWSRWYGTSNATCTHEGHKFRSCNACGKREDVYTPITDHHWDNGVVTKAATQTSTGIKTYTCINCKTATKTEVIPMLSHTHAYTARVTAPTCTAQGYTTYTCSCGDSYRSSYRSALGHSWDKGTVTRAATTTAEGSKTYRCTRCSATKTEVIAKLPSNQLATPTITSLTPTTAGITVKWGKVTGAVNYRVFYKAAGDSKFTSAGDTTAASKTVTGLTSGVKYIFTVQCISKDGKSYTSSYQSSAPVTFLSAPTVTAAKNAASGVTVTWKAVPGAENYRVYYKADGAKSWTNAGDTTATAKTVTGLTSGTKYTFVVRCMNAAGSAYTSAYYTAGKTVTYIAAPTITSLTPTTAGITVKWGKVTGAVNYRVFYKAAGDSKFTSAGDTTAASKTVTGLTSGVKYIFTVQCISKDGKSYTSSYLPDNMSIIKR